MFSADPAVGTLISCPLRRDTSPAKPSTRAWYRPLGLPDSMLTLTWRRLGRGSSQATRATSRKTTAKKIAVFVAGDSDSALFGSAEYAFQAVFGDEAAGLFGHGLGVAVAAGAG